MSAIGIGQAIMSLAVMGIFCVIVFIKTQPMAVVQPLTTVVSGSTAVVQLQAPVDLQIQADRDLVQKVPNDPDGYNRLAATYMQ